MNNAGLIERNCVVHSPILQTAQSMQNAMDELEKRITTLRDTLVGSSADRPDAIASLKSLAPAPAQPQVNCFRDDLIARQSQLVTIIGLVSEIETGLFNNK